MNKEHQVLHKMTMIAACLLAMVSTAAGEERKLTLQQAIDLALDQNHSVKMARYGLAAELEKQRGVRSSYFPTLSNESNALYVTDLQRIEVPPGTFGATPGAPLIPSSTVYLSQGRNAFQSSSTMLAQPITQLIKIHESNKMAADEVGISQASLRKTSTDVVYNVHEVYYRLLTAQLQRQAAELQITASDEGLNESGDQFKNGSLLQAALIENRANSLEAKQTLLKTDMDISDLTTQLNDLLGLALDTKLVLDPGVDTAFDLPTREDALAVALKDNPEVQQAIKKVSEAQAAEGAAKAEYIPDLTAYARDSYQNGVPLLDHNFGIFGVHFSYDVFDAGKRRALIRERRDEVSQAEENLKQTKEEVGVRITTVYNKIETTRAMVEVAREYLAARQENARLSDNEFKQGELMPSQRDISHAQAIKAQAGLLENSLSYLLARDELTVILGRTAP
jgi:outer membrane protein TolC